MSTVRASRVFWRVYVVLAALVLLVGAVLELVLETHFGQAQLEREKTMLEGSFHYAQSRWRVVDRVSSTQYLKVMQQQLAMDVGLYWLDDFVSSEQEYQELIQGQIVVLYSDNDQPVFYRRLNDSDQVLALTPPVMSDNPVAYWVVPLFYTVIGLVLFLWMRPLARDLDILQRSAQRFGRQDFSTRVSVGARSWLRPVGEAFNGMAERIQWLVQSHRELTHAVSHELRTPLARMRFALEMMSGDASSEARERHRLALSDDIEEINNLIEEMLGYAQLSEENLAPRLEPVDLRAWLEKYLADLTLPGLPCAVSSDIAPDVGDVMVDVRLLTRALDNLLSNAGRYASSVICVRACITDAGCCVCVDDDGPGIAPSQRELVLRAFHRSTAVQGSVDSGFGLGLAIVGRIALLHRGDVHIAQAPEGGARVGMRWPGCDMGYSRTSDAHQSDESVCVL